MELVVTAVPLLVLAVIVALILASALRGRVAWTPRVPKPRAPRPPKTVLRDVSRDRMDEELNELLRRR